MYIGSASVLVHCKRAVAVKPGVAVLCCSIGGRSTQGANAPHYETKIAGLRLMPVMRICSTCFKCGPAVGVGVCGVHASVFVQQVVGT